MESILTIDTGGTKTRLVEYKLSPSDPVDTRSAVITKEHTYPTPYGPEAYLKDLIEAIDKHFPSFADTANHNVMSLAIREIVENDVVTSVKLGWNKFPIVDKIYEQFGAKLFVQNDAKLGSLGAFESEPCKRGLFLTIGTGIGGGLVIDGKLSDDLLGMEIGKSLITQPGTNDLRLWEDFASGKAFYERYVHSNDIVDAEWHNYANDLAVGLLAALPTLYPDKILIGGSMARYFPKYGETLSKIISEKTWDRLSDIKIKAASDFDHVTNLGALKFALDNLESSYA